MFTRQGIWCTVAFLLFFLTTHLFFPSLVDAGEDSLTSEEYLSGEMPAETTEVDTSSAAEFQGTGAAGVDLFWLILKICGVLFLLSGGIYVLARLLKNTKLAGGGNEFMKVLSSLPVGRDKYLRVVQVGKQFFVIGVTEGAINRLCEIEDGETIQSLKMAAEQSNSASSQHSNSFKSVLQRFLGNPSFGADSKSSSRNTFDEIQKKLEEISIPGESSR